MFGSIVHKKKEHRETYISLYLDVHEVAVSFWMLGNGGLPSIEGSASQKVTTDSWEARGETIDRLIGVLEEKTHLTDATKMILGLPATYLTATGDIQKEIKLEIKELAKLLELEPIGFVPLHQAIIYKLKRDEGIPPSVILLGISDNSVSMSLYKIGALSGVRELEKSENIAVSVDRGIKSFTDVEVLPARMLLYGADTDELEDIKSELLRYPWTSRVNFLHFPKIETITNESIIESISLAGASELGQVNLEPGATEGSEIDAAKEVREPVFATEREEKEAEPALDEDGESGGGEDDENIHVSVADETPKEEREEEKVEEEKVGEEVVEAQKDIEEDFAVDETAHEDANVVMVDAKSMGFQKNVDILEKNPPEKEEAEEETDEEEFGRESAFGTASLVDHLPHISPAKIFGNIGNSLKTLTQQTRGGALIALGVFVLFLLFGLYWFLPHASVIVLQIPKPIQTSQTITIDPTATTADAQNKIIPGKKIEKSVSEQKTIPVQGKKNIGDPARGAVTIYNESTSSDLSLSKGTVISSGSQQFTLDSDVDVASASTSLLDNGGTTTFGTATVNVTAVQIGPQGNMQPGITFSIKGYSSDVAIARNSAALAGGTTKQVTVVSRSDYDALVKAATDDLVQSAKQSLSASLEGNQKLIDQTIATSVTEKVFTQELDQQATQLQGKITITVSGIAYSDSDIRALLVTTLGDTVPAGYSVDQNKTTIVITKTTVKKDGTIVAPVTMSGIALPTVDTEAIRKYIAGKSLTDAQNYLKTITGIAGLEVSYKLNPTKGRLPLNVNNISISLKALP